MVCACLVENEEAQENHKYDRIRHLGLFVLFALAMIQKQDRRDGVAGIRRCAIAKVIG